ncbi:uncharacterized protein [Hetaerina americana]|uniref:uncharacterized protein n=1 Tax=Hetaerina americana TaxID=62018 RepID=UPI003A7F170C
MKKPENVSLTNSSREPDLTKESKRSQQTNLESVPIVSSSIADAENQSLSVKTDGKNKSFSPIVGCEPELETLSKSDKNDLVISGNSINRTNSPSQVQISDEKSKIVDEGSKHENLDNNEIFSLPDGKVVKEKSERENEPDSSVCSGGNLDSVCIKDRNDLKILTQVDKVATVMESKPVSSTSSSSMVKSVLEKTTKKSVDSVNKEEIPSKSVDSNKVTIRKNLEGGVDNSTTLGNVHSNKNFKTCDSVPAMQKEELFGEVVEIGGPVFQGNPLLNPVKDESMRLPSASTEVKKLEPSMKNTGAFEGAGRDDRKIDVADGSSMQTSDAKDVKEVMPTGDNTPLNQPTQVFHVALETKCSEETKMVMNDTDKEILKVSLKVNVVQDTIVAKCSTTKSEATIKLDKVNPSIDVSKSDDKVIYVSADNKVKVPAQIVPIQAKDEGYKLKDVSTLKLEQGKGGEKHNHPTTMPTSVVQDTSKECPDSKLVVEKSSLGCTSDVVSINSVPDVKEISEKLAENESSTVTKSKPLVTTVVKEDKPDLISEPLKSDSLPKTCQVSSSTLIDENAKKLTETEKIDAKDIPCVSKIEVEKLEVVSSPSGGGDKETPKGIETKIIEKSHSMEVILSKSDSVPQREKVEVGPEVKVSGLNNMPPASSVNVGEVDNKTASTQEKLNEDLSRMNFSEKTETSKPVNETSLEDASSKQNEKSFVETVLCEVAPSTERKQEEKGNPEKSSLPLESADLLPLIETSKVTKESESINPDSSILKLKEDADASNKTSTVVNKDTATKVEEKDKVIPVTNEAEPIRKETKTQEYSKDTSLKDEPSTSKFTLANSSADSATDTKIKEKSEDHIVEQQNVLDGIELKALSVSPENALSCLKKDDPITKPIPDLLNVAQQQSLATKNSNDQLEMGHKVNTVEALSTDDKVLVREVEVVKLASQKVDEVSTISSEKNVAKDNAVQGMKEAKLTVKDKVDQLDPTESPDKSLFDKKSLDEEPENNSILQPNHDSKMKIVGVSLHTVNSPITGEPKPEYPATLSNDVEVTESSKLKKRGDLKHSREKSILGITEKLAVANQMRQQKQGALESALKESSSPKKMPGLIEMGVAKASRRKNLIVKDDQRMYKKTKVISIQDSSDAGTSKDLIQPSNRQGMEITLGKSDITLGMGQSLNEMARNVPNLQPEVIIAAELSVTEKTMPSKKDGVGLDSFTVIDLSSKSIDSPKESQFAGKVSDGLINLVDRPSPSTVEKHGTEAAFAKERDNKEYFEIDRGSFEDQKDGGSFKFPRVKRNSGKEKSTVQVVPPSAAGPTTRTRANFKPPSSSPVKSIAKVEESKEKTYPKTVKGFTKGNEKTVDIEVKRKSMEVSTEPFSKQLDAENKRVDYAEEALSIRAINAPGSSSKLLEVIRVAEEKGKDIVKVNDVEVMREPVGSNTAPLSLMRKPPNSSPMFSSISLSAEVQRKDSIPQEMKSTAECMQTDVSSLMCKFPSGNTESWEFVAKVGEVELLRESPRATPKPTPPPVTITMEPAIKKPMREKTDSGPRKPGRPSSMPPPSKTPDYSATPPNTLEQAFMTPQNLRNHSLEVLVGIGNRPGDGSTMDPRAQVSSMAMQVGNSSLPHWTQPTDAHFRVSGKATGMDTFLSGRKTPVGDQGPESDSDKRKKGSSKARNAPPPRWSSREADMLSVKVDGHSLGTWSPSDWRSLPPVHMWPPGYSGFGPPLRPRGPVEPRCSRSVSPPSHSGRDRRSGEHMPEDLSSPPLPRGRRESPHSFRPQFVHPATSFPGTPSFSNVSVMSYTMPKNNNNALNLAKPTTTTTVPSDTAMNLTMCRQPPSTPTPPPVISSPSVQQSPRQSFPVNLVKSRSSSPKAPAQQAQSTLPDGRGAVLPGGIIVPNLPLIFGRDYAVGSPSTPPSGRISHCSAEESRDTRDSAVGQVVRCSSEPPRDHMTERRPRESPIMSGFVPTAMPPRTSAACQTNQSIQSFPVPRPSSAMSSLEQVPTSGVSRSTVTEANLLPGGVVIPNLYGANGFRPGEEQWIPQGADGGRLDLPPRSASAMSQHHPDESTSKQVNTRMPTPIPSISTTPIPPSSTPPPAPPQRTGPGRRGGRAETPPPDKYNFRIEEAHVVMSGGGHGGAGGKLFACDICSGVYRRAFSLKRHYLRAHINYCHLSERDLSNCGIVVGDRMAVHSGGSGRRPYVHTTLPRSASKSPEGEPERVSGRRTLLRDLFRCHTCGVCFDEKRRLKAHLMEHQCGSNRPSLLRQHAATHHVLPPTVAPRPTPTPRPHPSSPTPTVYLCAYCDKRFSSAAVRRRHRKLHESSPGPHPCYLCETAEDTPEMPLGETPSFAHLEDLRSHMASIHKELYHSCALCGERLPTLLALEEHAEEHRSRRQATEQSDEEEEEEDAELVRAAVAAVAPTESPRQSEGSQAVAPSQGDEEEFRYTCGVCQKMFTNFVNMCRHRRLAHGATQAKAVGRKVGASSAGKGQAGGRDSESSSRSQSPVVVSQASERGHRDLLDGEPSSSSSSVPSPCPYPSAAAAANDPETIFYTRLAGNIRENLLNYLDGKLNKLNSSDKQSKDETKGAGYENEGDEEVKLEPTWEKYNFPKDFQQMSYWDISTQLVVRNNLKKVSNAPSVEPDPEHRPAFPETLALVETNKSGDQANKEEVVLKSKLEEEVVEGEWSGLSGEWVRPRSYICCACASRFCDLWALEDHKLARHPNVWCTHLEVEDGAVVLPGSPKLSPGSANVAVSFLGDLLCRRPLGPRGALLSAPSVPPTLNNGMESPSARCTKCSRVCPSLPDLHSHMLECGGDIAWAAWAGGSSPAASSRRNSRKWRPFGSRRRRQRGRRGMKRNIPSSPVKMHRARHRGTDSDSIQRMIANLPAKRATRRVIQFNEDEIKTRSQATIHSVSFPGNFVRVSGYKAPLGVKGTPPTAAKRGRPPKNPLPPTPLNIEGMAIPSTSMAMPPMGIPQASAAAGGVSPQGIVKKGRGRPPGSKSRNSATNSDFALKRRFGESMGEGYSPEGDRYAMSKRARPGASPVNQHPVGSTTPSVPGEPYDCKGCGAVFDNASSCERHGKKCVFRLQMPIMPVGEGLKPTPSGSVRPVHACPHCGKNFTYATPMEKHVRVCGSSSIPRGPPVHVRRATAPSVLGRPPKADEEDEGKKDSETQEESLLPSEEAAESPPSEPPQEPDMPQLQKEEPVASPPTKDDDIPVLTPVEPEEEEAIENVEEVIAQEVKEGNLPDEPEIEVSIPSEVDVAVADESEVKASAKEEESDIKPLDEPVMEVKEEVVELVEEAPAEENIVTPLEPEQIAPEVPVEETPNEALAEEVTTEMEEREESPESEDATLRTTGKRTRGTSSSGQVTKKSKVEEETEEPAGEVDTPKKKGGKKSMPLSARGKSPKGLRNTRGTKGEDEMTSEGEDKKEKEDAVKEEAKVEEVEDEEEVQVKAEEEDIAVQIDKEADQKKGKEVPKATDEPEGFTIDKEDDAEKEDPSMSESRGKRGRRGKYSAKTSASTSEVVSKATTDKVDSTPVTPRQGKRRGASLERPSSPKVEETSAAVVPEIEPKVTRGSAIAQSKVSHSKEKDISKEDKGRLSASKKKEEEEVTVSSKEEKSMDVEKTEGPSIVTKEVEDNKVKDSSEVEPEPKESGTKIEDSEEEEEDDDGKEKDEKDSKLRGTKGSKGKVTKKSHKKKKKQELKREVENFWCNVCEMGYSSAFNLVKHGQSQKHKWNQKLAKEKADAAAAKGSKEGEKCEDKKGDNEEEGSNEVKVHDSGKKGVISEGKESDKASGEGKDSEKASSLKSSESGKGDNDKKVEADGKSTKKRSDGEAKDKSGIADVSNDKEMVSSKGKSGEESEETGIDEAGGGEQNTVQDKKGKKVISEDESITNETSAKEKVPEKRSPEKKSQEKKPEKKLLEKKSPEKKLPEKKSPEKNLQEKNLQEKNLQEKNLQEKNLPEKNGQEKNLLEKNLQEKNLQEKNLQEKNLQEKNLQEKNLQEKNLQEKKASEKKAQEKKLPEKKTSEKKSQEKKSPDKKSQEKKSPEKKPQDVDINENDSEEENLSSDDKLSGSLTTKSKEIIIAPKEDSQSPLKEVAVKEQPTPPAAAEECTSANLPAAPDEASHQEGPKKPPTKDVTDGSLIGQTANERGSSGQGDNQPAPAQEAEGSITKVSPEATVAAAPESATVIEGTKNANEDLQCGIWPDAPAATPSQEFVQPPAPPPTTYSMLYEWNVGMVQQAPVQQAPPPPPPPPQLPPQQPSINTHMHPVQQDSWGSYGGWEAPIVDPNPPPSPGLWRYQPPNPIPWTEPQHSLSPIPRVPSYEDPPPVTHPSTPNPSPPNPSLGSILDSVNRILGEDVPGFDSSRIQPGATAPEEEYGGVGLYGEGLAELQLAMGATDEEMAMLQQLGTGPLDFVYDNNAIPANVAYNAAESNDQTGPLPNPELVDLDNQSAAVTIAADGLIEEAETASLPPVAADSASYFTDGRGGKRRRCGPPPSKCKKIVPPPRESNRGWRGGRRLLPTQASLASAHLLISQYEKKEMVCPMCNRHFLGLAALETHVAWVHKVKDAKQHILEGATDGQPSGKKPNPAASNTLRELVAGRGVGGVVVGAGVTSSPTPSRRLPCFVCKELYSDVISLNHHIAQQHLRRRPGEGGAVPEMDGNLKSQMTSALGGLLGKALANMRSRSDASLSLQKPGLPAIANKSPLFSTFPKLNLLSKSLDAINKMSSTGDSSNRKSFGGPSSSEGTSEGYSRAAASSDSPEVALFRREDGLDPSEWSSDGEDSAKGQEAEGQLDEGEMPSFHHICPFCGDRFQRVSSRNRHITWAHRDMTCMDMRVPRSCSHESSDFDELLGRGRREEGGDGGSIVKEDSEESQETGRRHSHHPCPACQLTFLRHSQLEAHLKRAHNGIDSPLPDNSDSMMECPICRESMNNFLKLCKHVKTKHREWSINCFTTEMHHHLILRKESPEESMVIRKKFLVKMKAFPVLRMASPTPSSRSSEEESYMDPDPKGNYLCSVCGVNFKSPQGVIRHLNLEHNSNHLEGALPMQKIFPRHATKEYRSRSGGGLGSDIKAKAEAALRELNLSQKLKLGAVTTTKGMMTSKSGLSKKSTSSTSDSNDPSVATTSKGSGRGRGSGRRGRGKRGGSRGGMSSDVEKSLFDVYEFEDDDDDLEETPSRVGSADGSSRVGSECGDDDEDEDAAEDDGKSVIGSAASIRGKRGSVDSSSSDAKYSCNACGKGYKSLTAFWKHTKGVRGACVGGGSSPGRSGERGSQEGSSGPSVRKASGSRKGGGVKEDEDAVSSDVESEVGGTVRVLRRLRGSTSGASDIGGTEGSTETLHSSEAVSEAAPKRGDKGGGRGGKGKRKGGSAEEEKKSLFPGGETVRTYGGKRSAKQHAEERRGRGGGGGDDGESAGGSRRSLGASEAAFDALRGGGSS